MVLGRSSLDHLDVSVVLATFNGARFLSAFLESIEAQTVAPAEMIVCDDQSTDETLQIVQAFAERSRFPVHVTVNSERRGYRDNFLHAALQARGALVSFADQDDVWAPEKLARCVPAFLDESVLLCAHAATITDADLKPIGRLGNEIEGEAVIEPRTLPPWAVFFGFTQVFRRSLLGVAALDRRPPDNIDPSYAMAHDRWITMLAGGLGRVALIPSELALFRQHGGNASSHLSHGISIERILSTTAADHHLHAGIARRMAEVFADIAQKYGPHAEEAGQTVAYWRRFERLYELRAEVYAKHTFTGRVAAFSALTMESGYGGGKATSLGRKAQIKDLVLGAVASGLRTRATASR